MRKDHSAASMSATGSAAPSAMTRRAPSPIVRRRAPYANGVILVVSQNAAGIWSLAFASPSYHFNKGENAAIDVTFDGQEQARLFATAYQPNMLTAVMPLNVVRTFQKASLMVATAGRAVLNFDLTSTGPVIAALANCVTKVKADGLDKAGDFTKGTAKPAATADKQGSPPASKPGKGAKSASGFGTGFVVSAQWAHRHQQPRDRRLQRAQGQSHRRSRDGVARGVERREQRSCSYCRRRRRRHSRSLPGSATARSAPAIPSSRSAFPSTDC